MDTPFTSTPITTPDDLTAFQAEYNEWLDLVASTMPLPEPEVVERDLCDIVREHEESMTEEEMEEYERQCLRFDDPFEME